MPDSSTTTSDPSDSRSTLASRSQRWLRHYPWAPVLGLLVVAFFWCLARFYSPKVGFTSLLVIGDTLTPSQVLLDQHPYIYKGTSGYDGQAYVQIALDPLLHDPELSTSVDSLAYRARRIFVPACAWLAGLGQPAWIVEAYALSNVAGWLLLGWVLLRWLPPDSLQNLFRWAGIMFSHGISTSFSNALPDGPGMALLALGMALAESGRTGGALAGFATAMLSRETYFINVAAALVPPRLRDPKAWRRAALLVGAATAPLLLWIIYVRLHTNIRPVGSRNFALPGVGYLGRWRELLSKSDGEAFLLDFRVVGCLGQIALTVQFLYILLRPRLDNAWWRVGAISALLGCVLGPSVWASFPSASLRVLLPLTIAFNLLVPRSAKAVPLLILGNLTLFGGIQQMMNAPLFSDQWQGMRGAIHSTSMDAGTGWYQIEGNRKHIWRWCAGSGELLFTNRSQAPVEVRLSGKLSALSPREILILRDGSVLWRSDTVEHIVPFQTPPITIAPGVCRLVVTSDHGPVRPSRKDSRPLSFALYDLVLSVSKIHQAP